MKNDIKQSEQTRQCANCKNFVPFDGYGFCRLVGVKIREIDMIDELYAEVFEETDLCSDWNAAIAKEWQPIETAPKDGSYILIYTGEFAIEGCWIDANKFDDEGFYTAEKYKNEIYNPTHWLPLKPPETKT